MEQMGFYPAEVCLPENSSYEKWSVVACDQYTSQPEYWEEVEQYVGDAPSTLRMIIPELYLNEPDAAERIARINRTMDQYIDDGVFKTEGGFVLVKRTLRSGAVRMGLVGAVDLECYSFAKGSRSLVRATEGTVLERIPPRVQVRENAILECPHIMLLIDDPQQTVIEPTAQEGLQKLYEFPLMQESGSLEGWLLDGAETERVMNALGALADKKSFNRRYGFTGSRAPLLFAVGDGNHSLAAAKAHYENLKKILPEEKYLSHPARYALAEVTNLHDPSLEFEPIHRVVFDIDEKKLEQALLAVCTEAKAAGAKQPARAKAADSPAEPEAPAKAASIPARKKETASAISEKPAASGKAETGKAAVSGKAGTGRKKKAEAAPEVPALQKVVLCKGKDTRTLFFQKAVSNLPVGTLQAFLDDYIKKNGGRIDYIHGDDVVRELSAQKNCLGFLLEAMPKEQFFKTVVLDGALPRKTFSMGRACDKRFYLECRKITP